MRSLICTGLLLAATISIAQPVPGSGSSSSAGTTADGLLLRTATGVRPATRLASEIDIEVTGIVARVTIVQRFRNPSADWVEGVYVFPLPEGAAVDRLVLVIGDRRIEGEIQEREQARRTYEMAREAGQQASLVEQERPNLFTTSVANIAPGEEVAVEIAFLKTADYDDGEFSLRLPLTLTPRFVPEGVADAARITTPLRSPARDDSHRTSIDVLIGAGMPLASVGSPSHALETRREADAWRLRTAQPLPMDRDLLLAWRIVADQTPRVTAFTETRNGDSYLLLMFLPPTAASLPDPRPREIVFVIDTSGSMGGEPIRQARAALLSGFDRLRPNDRFNVIEFNSAARALYPEAVSFTRANELEARRFVAGLDADGGTNIADALRLALVNQPLPGMLRQIVFVTDGSVGNESQLFGMIGTGLGESRLFTVGIGAAPNNHFMRKAAEFGRGSYSHIAKPDEVEPEMAQLFAKLEFVALTDIAIDWPAGFEPYPERVPDLYRGEPVVVAARSAGALPRTLTIETTGSAGLVDWSQRFDVMPGTASGVAALWARRRIEDLLDSSLDGTSPDAIRAAVVDVAIEHSLLNPYTSLVAVDRTPERSRDALLRREQLGNLPPAGSDFGRLAGLPATATDSRWYQLIGIVLTALALGLFGIWRLTRKLGR